MTGAPSGPATINLHIDRLVLEGISPHDRQAVAEALQAELSHLFASQAPPPLIAESGAYHRLDAAMVHPAAASPGGLGASVARAIFGGMQR